MTKEFRNIKYNSEKKELTAGVGVLGWLRIEEPIQGGKNWEEKTKGRRYSRGRRTL